MDWTAGRGTAGAAGCSASGVLGTGQQRRCSARNNRGAGPPGGCSWMTRGRRARAGRARLPVGAATHELEGDAVEETQEREHVAMMDDDSGLLASRIEGGVGAERRRAERDGGAACRGRRLWRRCLAPGWLWRLRPSSTTWCSPAGPTTTWCTKATS
jgi:hypothetical protein